MKQLAAEEVCGLATNFKVIHKPGKGLRVFVFCGGRCFSKASAPGIKPGRNVRLFYCNKNTWFFVTPIMQNLYFLILILLPLISKGQVPIAVKSLQGSYLAQAYERDTIQNAIVPVYLKLTLNADSTFSYNKQSDKGHCNSNRAGYWNSLNGIVNLEFVGEEPLSLSINEGPNYFSLINKPEKITLFKQQPRLYEAGQGHQQKSNNKSRKSPPCPTF
jgi:hypothetical protein